jgi:subtilisin family serine protease
MKRFNLLTCALLLLLSAGASAQAPLVSFTFDDATSLDEWEIFNDPNTWRWVSDGTASSFDPTFWHDRPAIRSKSGGGAVAIASTEGLFDRLTSPVVGLSGQDSVYLRFNEYFREFQSFTQVSVRNTITNDQLNFNLHANVPIQAETSYRAEQVFDITSIAAADTAALQISFLYEGSGYFWVIDDVEFYNTYPYPETRPGHYRDTLSGLGYDFDTDDSGWPYEPNEVVVQFDPGTPESVRAGIRDTLGATLLDSCVCNTLELWGLGDSILYNQDGILSPGGPTIGVQERVLGATASTVIQGVDPNYYTLAELQSDIQTNNLPLQPSDIAGLQDAPSGAVRIAVLDTGVDFQLDTLSKYIYLKPDNLGNNTDDDTNCYPDDPIGWDFVSETDLSNNPMDDHSHGTHVAGIVAQNLDLYGGADCDFHIIPYKTHDAQGVSNLFQVTCATYQAIQDSVSLINDSWGFYGDSSTVLRNAIDSAALNDILIISSAGNDSLMLDTLLQYPACYQAPNRLTVGAVFDTLGMNEEPVCAIAPFSNFSNQWVDILAPGVSIRSYLPGGGFGAKSGTSMSAPAVTAAAAIAYCKLGEGATFAEVRQAVLEGADTLSYLQDYARDGLKLNIPKVCLVPATEVVFQNFAVKVFPNPTTAGVSVLPERSLGEATLSLYHLSGQLQWKRKVEAQAGAPLSVDLSGLPSGLYVLRMVSGQGQWSTRLIKQ